MSRLFLIRGLPGSGKTTLAESIVRTALMDTPGVCSAVMPCADDYFYKGGKYEFDPNLLPEAHRACRDRVLSAMERDVPTIVVHNTFTRIWEMQAYLEAAQTHGYSVQIIECKGSFGSEHNVPVEAMKRMSDRWEMVPAWEEMDR